MSQESTVLNAFIKRISEYVLVERTLVLSLPQMRIIVKSNSLPLIDTLTHYFRHIVEKPEDQRMDSFASIEIKVFNDDEFELNAHWQDWSREPGKSGRKDAYLDADDCRLLYKVKTGMVFLQSQAQLIAVGPCDENPNQVINFINNQYMNRLQNQGWLINHAAALGYTSLKDKKIKAIAFAGFSGGGKSTSMLHLLSSAPCRFLSNDRLFTKVENGKLWARGIPKLPRINPGTILNNSKLTGLLHDSDKDRYLAMDQDALWSLEEKYDVDVIDIFGKQAIESEAELTSVIILDWSRKSSSPCTIQKIKLTDKPELAEALMKSSGPFYQKSEGDFLDDGITVDRAPYLDLYEMADVYQVSGRVDFQMLQTFCIENLINQ